MRIYNLPSEDREKIKKRITDFLINRKEVLFAYIHGSFIENRPFRDIDVAIYVDGDHDLAYELEMEEELT
ncbi:MAG TPA: nucleotidyltransferase domain-containing protein, partial [Thermococcaceae archaeon]|nr:nucleotidyltransferase domain-containing protein [Thermococcaceae archaeon]